MDKYGAGQDRYCYADTDVLSNLLDIRDAFELSRAERDFSELAASQISSSFPLMGFNTSKAYIPRFFGMSTRGQGKSGHSTFQKAVPASAIH